MENLRWFISPGITVLVAIIGLAAVWGRMRSEMQQFQRTVRALQDQVHELEERMVRDFISEKTHEITCRSNLGAFFREILVPELRGLRDEIVKEIRNGRS